MGKNNDEWHITAIVTMKKMWDWLDMSAISENWSFEKHVRNKFVTESFEKAHAGNISFIKYWASTLKLGNYEKATKTMKGFLQNSVAISEKLDFTYRTLAIITPFDYKLVHSKLLHKHRNLFTNEIIFKKRDAKGLLKGC